MRVRRAEGHPCGTLGPRKVASNAGWPSSSRTSSPPAYPEAPSTATRSIHPEACIMRKYAGTRVGMSCPRWYAAAMSLLVTPGPIAGPPDRTRGPRDPDRPGGRSVRCSTMRRFARPASRRSHPVQWNISESAAGTLRGFHAEPWNKLVHVASGRVFAAIADIRRGLADRRHGLDGRARSRAGRCSWARGSATGSRRCPTSRCTPTWSTAIGRPARDYPYVAWDDPDLAVSWPITDERLAMSAKDRANPTLRDHWAR